MSLTQNKPRTQPKGRTWALLPVIGSHACGHPIPDRYVYDPRIEGDREAQTAFAASRNCYACGMSAEVRERNRVALGLTPQYAMPAPLGDPLVTCDECGVEVKFSTCRVTHATTLICTACDRVEFDLRDVDAIEKVA